ncbi:MAG: hypothetical protein EOP41_03255 [Sphingobacteriaceae bacterium]|nr:MAG: hypothetical protein EOP41_03255 [Sphingobacteriaceae bacterium]
MKLTSLLNWFLPDKLKNNSLHPDYDQVYTLVSACFFAAIVLPLVYGTLYCLGYRIDALIYNGLMCFGVLLFIRKGFIKVPVTLMGMITYIIYYPYIANSGGIYSPMVGFLYVYLIGAYWGDPKTGAYATGLNILILYFLYQHTSAATTVAVITGGKQAAFIIHASGMFLLGALLWVVQRKQDQAREETKHLQNHRIEFLDIEIARRTEQLNQMRQSLATDFHDETGNLLSAITRQAGLLKLQLSSGDPALPMANSIIRNSNELYTSGRNFLWNLNHESDDPQVLFEYLASFGQSLYNQFDISFSTQTTKNSPSKIDPFASLSLVFIFKEAMHNVIKHSGASEVIFKMASFKEHIEFTLSDNGCWKQPGEQDGHYGLQNMKLRCSKHRLKFELHPGPSGTRVEVAVPVLLQPISVPV